MWMWMSNYKIRLSILGNFFLFSCFFFVLFKCIYTQMLHLFHLAKNACMLHFPFEYWKTEILKRVSSDLRSYNNLMYRYRFLYMPTNTRSITRKRAGVMAHSHHDRQMDDIVIANYKSNLTAKIEINGCVMANSKISHNFNSPVKSTLWLLKGISVTKSIKANEQTRHVTILS